MIRKLSHGRSANKRLSRVWKLCSLTEISTLPERDGEEIRRMLVDVAQRSWKRLKYGK